MEIEITEDKYLSLNLEATKKLASNHPGPIKHFVHVFHGQGMQPFRAKYQQVSCVMTTYSTVSNPVVTFQKGRRFQVYKMIPKTRTQAVPHIAVDIAKGIFIQMECIRYLTGGAFIEHGASTSQMTPEDFADFGNSLPIKLVNKVNPIPSL